MFGLLKKIIVSTCSTVAKAADWVAKKLAPAPAKQAVVLRAPQRGIVPRLKEVAFAACAAVAVLYATTATTFAAAAVDAGIQEASDSFNLTFTLVKAGAIGVLIFAVGYKIARRWLGK